MDKKKTKLKHQNMLGKHSVFNERRKNKTKKIENGGFLFYVYEYNIHAGY